MKIQGIFSGVFERTLISGEEKTQSVSLVGLVQEVQAVASQHYGRSPEQLRRSFNLDSVPESVLIHLLKQANQVSTEEQLYQVPSLRWLKPLSSTQSWQSANFYRYQFISEATDPNFTLNLAPDDPQIPVMNHNETSRLGTYDVTLQDAEHPFLPSLIVHRLWEQTRLFWQEVSSAKLIHRALQTIPSESFPVHLTSDLILWIDLEDLSLEQRTAITALQQLRFEPETDLSGLAESVQVLVQQYQTSYGRPVDTVSQLKKIGIAPLQSTPSQWVIGRGDLCNRAALEAIIRNARQFLLISSYIIEDESLSRLIGQKAQELSEGVWILTDLRDEVIDFIDAQVETKTSEFQNSNEHKKGCLKQLLESNVKMRSGSFHLKTVISEQAAYLGSCNLTGGSLGRNLEAGVVFSQTPAHAELLDQFRYFWEWHSRDQVLPANNCDHFSLRSLSYPYGQQPHYSQESFLSVRQYQQDLERQLASFRGYVHIYSRSFNPSARIHELLSSTSIKTRVFVDSNYTPRSIPKQTQIHRIFHLHAKITIIGDHIAYIGGVNFNFNPRATMVKDLMYKTTSLEEIKQIYQAMHSMLSIR